MVTVTIEDIMSNSKEISTEQYLWIIRYHVIQRFSYSQY